MSALVTHFGPRPDGGRRGFARLAVVGAILLAALVLRSRSRTGRVKGRLADPGLAAND